MKVLALTRYGPLGASSRVRFMQFETPLRALGVEVMFSPLLDNAYLRTLYSKKSTDWGSVFRGYLRRIIVLASSGRFDLIWLEKELFPNMPAWFEWALEQCRIPVVVDYDDAIFHTYDQAGAVKKAVLGTKIDKVMKMASIVVCGNPYLAERAMLAGANDVVIVPTVIDLDRYEPCVNDAGRVPVIGWIGSPATIKYLDIIAPVLQRLSAEIPFELRVIGGEFALEGVEVTCVPWQLETEVEQIRQFDIGIMPLVDSTWERGKCGYKLVQYMACGKAVVASAVGVNTEIVRDHENGFLATSEQEWTDALRTLLLDRQTRDAFGRLGRLQVEQRYCVQVTAPVLQQLFTRASAHERAR